MSFQVRPRELVIEECNIQNTPDYNFQFRPTIPIFSNSITLKFGSIGVNTNLLSSCEIELGEEDVGKWKNMTAQVVCDNTNRPSQGVAFTFSVTDFHTFWYGYELPSVLVSTYCTQISNRGQSLDEGQRRAKSRLSLRPLLKGERFTLPSRAKTSFALM